MVSNEVYSNGVIYNYNIPLNHKSYIFNDESRSQNGRFKIIEGNGYTTKQKITLINELDDFYPLNQVRSSKIIFTRQSSGSYTYDY